MDRVLPLDQKGTFVSIPDEGEFRNVLRLAIEQFSLALKLSPRAMPARYRRALALFFLGLDDEAAEDARVAWDDGNLRGEQFAHLMRLFPLDERLLRITSLLQEDGRQLSLPDWLMLRFSLAFCYYELQGPARYKEELENLISEASLKDVPEPELSIYRRHLADLIEETGTPG